MRRVSLLASAVAVAACGGDTQGDGAAGVAPAGVFFALGGRSAAIGWSGRLDAYGPRTGAWSQRAPMPTPRGGLMAAILPGRIVACGGEGNAAAANGMFAQTEGYEIATDSWVR